MAIPVIVGFFAGMGLLIFGLRRVDSQLRSQLAIVAAGKIRRPSAVIQSMADDLTPLLTAPWTFGSLKSYQVSTLSGDVDG